MIYQRAAILLAGTAGALAFAAPAQAQIADEIAMDIMRQCARIADPAARLACFENTLRSADASPRNNSLAASRGASSDSSAVTPSRAEEARESRTPDRPASPPPAVMPQQDQIDATVARTAEREPGIYLVTLDDGALWLFTDPVGTSFVPPRRGATVKLMRGALGSYLMRVENQQPVRVRRIGGAN